ncbi:MAG: MOSC domain-containing protein [Gammaproteobacteria bacterium]|nr:MOSC domain-containing protein [Gammaproteobacteria bacterium]
MKDLHHINNPHHNVPTDTTLPSVIAVSSSAAHTFSKISRESIQLLVGLGVEGDAHNGHSVKHRSRVAKDPSQPNLRQIHLLHAELFDELHTLGFMIAAGQLGENITTRGIDLLGLPSGARLHIGDTAVVTLTGLRNPCAQLDNFQQGLLAAVVGRDEQGRLVRKAGVMGIVTAAGSVKPKDAIVVELPEQPHVRLEKV